MATGNLGVCVTAFFKLASGLDLAKMNVSIDALLVDNTQRLEYFLKDKGISRNSHPVNPIRVEALRLFSTAKTQKKLNEGMEELINILLKVGDSELDEYTALFIASAGLIVANIDGDINEQEIEQIIESLAGLTMFPRNFLEEIAKGDVGAVFNNAVENILKIDPGIRGGMLRYMIHIVMSDKIIDKKEIEFIYSFGNNIGLSEIEVSNEIAASIQKNYIPSLNSIC